MELELLSTSLKDMGCSRNDRRAIQRKVKRLGISKYDGFISGIKSYEDSKAYSKLNPTEKIYGVYLRSDLDKNSNLTIELIGDGKVGKGFLLNGECKRDPSASGSTGILETLYFIVCKDEQSAKELEKKLHQYFDNVDIWGTKRNIPRVYNSDGKGSGIEWFNGFPLNKQKAIKQFITAIRKVTKEPLVGYDMFTPEYYQNEAAEVMVTFYLELLNSNKILNRKEKDNLFYLLMKPRAGKNPATLLGLCKILNHRKQYGNTDKLIVDFLSYWPSAFSGARDDADKFSFDGVTIDYIDTNKPGWKEIYNELINDDSVNIIIRFSSMQALVKDAADTYNNSEDKEGDDINFDETKLEWFKTNSAEICLKDEGDYGFRANGGTKINEELSYIMEVWMSGSDLYALKNLISDNNHYYRGIIEEDMDLRGVGHKLNRRMPQIRTHTVRPEFLANEDITTEELMSEAEISRRNAVVLSPLGDIRREDCRYDKLTNRIIVIKTGQLVCFKNKKEGFEYWDKTFNWRWNDIKEYDTIKPIDHSNIFWTVPSVVIGYALYNHLLNGDIDCGDREIINLNLPKFSDPFTMERRVTESMHEANINNKGTITITVGKMLRGAKLPVSCVVRMDDYSDPKVSTQINLRAQNAFGPDDTHCDIYDSNIFRTCILRDTIQKAASNGSNEFKQRELINTHSLIPIYCVNGSKSKYKTAILTVKEVDAYVFQNDEIKSFESNIFLDRNSENQKILLELSSIQNKNSNNVRDKRAGKVKSIPNNPPKGKGKIIKDDWTIALNNFKSLNKFLPILIILSKEDNIEDILLNIKSDHFYQWMSHTNNPIKVSDIDEWKQIILKLYDIEKINRKIRAFLTHTKGGILSANDIFKLARKSEGDVPTSETLINEILKYLPIDYWKTFPTMYNPSCGISAEFAVQWRDKLIEAGCTEPEKYIFIFDNSPLNLTMSLELLGPQFNKTNVYDYKNKKNMKDFNAILTNPPYQDITRPRHKPWVDFVKDFIDKAPIVGMVLPKMASLLLNGQEVNQKKIDNVNLICYNGYNVDSHFVEGSDFCYFIHDKNNKDTTFQNITKNGIENWNKNTYIPYNSNLIESKIISKILNFKNEYNRNASRVKETINGKYDCINKISKNGPVWMKTDNIHTNTFKPKLIYSTLGDGFYLDRIGNIMPSTSFVPYLLVDNPNELDSLILIKNSILFKFLIKQFPTMRHPIDYIWKSLRKINIDEITDKNIYDYFDLDEEQRQYINNYVK